MAAVGWHLEVRETAAGSGRGRAALTGRTPEVPLRCGIDLLDTARFAALLARRGAAEVERRLCGEVERAALPTDPGARRLALASSFSVKESALKTVGGMPRGGRFAHVEVLPVDGDGTCSVLLHCAVAKAADPGTSAPIRLHAGHSPIGSGLLLSWAVLAQEAHS